MASLITRSKFLSKVLRHQPSLAGVQLAPDGWVAVNDLLLGCQQAGVPMTLDELRQVVVANDKQRFAFSPDGTSIRASQGHSVAVDLNLETKAPPDFLYHGTLERLRNVIIEQGLLKMNRNHVHLSKDVATAAQVAQRRRQPWILFQVSAGVMAAKDFAFFQSANGVWLTDRVPPQYLEEIPRDAHPAP